VQACGCPRARFSRARRSEVDDYEEQNAELGWRPQIPESLQTIGRAAWIFTGIAVALSIAALFFGLISSLLIPLIFSTILAAILVPLVDRLESLGIRRWLGAPLVLLLAMAIVAVVVWMVLIGIIGAAAEIQERIDSGLEEAGSLAGSAEPDAEETRKIVVNVVEVLVGGVLKGLGSITVLIVGMVTGLFILLYLMKDWVTVLRWTSEKIGAFLGLPGEIGRRIVFETATSFRRYAAGLTIIGAANAATVGLGALLLGVPLAGSIAIVTFVTSYIPFFGAFFAGGFAVAIALGANGLGTALAILAITLLANNTLQNLIEPIAFGKTLQLHPLVVLLVTTGGTLLFGVLGATLAAPTTAVALKTTNLLRNIPTETMERVS